jgi:predicted PilT family ATPase
MRVKYIICFLTLSIFSSINAQAKRQFVKVEFPVKEQKFNELVMDKLNTKKKKGCLNYKLNENIEVKYCNDKTDDNYVEYYELGKIKNTEIIVVNKITYNEEFYILINPKERNTLTLSGLPLKIENSNKYLVCNNPSTDISYSIQILNMVKGEMKSVDKIIYPKSIIIKKVLRVDKKVIFIVDSQNQVWKTSINN